MIEIPLFRLGRCTVCDRRAGFISRNRNAPRLRGGLRCLRCGSQSRNRHVATLVAEAADAPDLGSLRARHDVRVLNTSPRSALARRLAGLDHVTHTGFWPDHPVGTEHEGVRCEDLTALTFDDATFDIVVTEDVLEHIPDHEAALTEIRRVLRRGGVHIFTIPFRLDQRSRPCFRMVDGVATLDEPINYHIDPGTEPIAVYHEFGHDLPEQLEPMGYRTRIVRSTVIDYRRHAIADCLTFVSRAV